MDLLIKFENEKYLKYFKNIYVNAFLVISFYIIWLFNLFYLTPFLILIVAIPTLIFTDKADLLTFLLLFIIFSLSKSLTTDKINIFLIIDFLIYGIILILFFIKEKKKNNLKQIKNINFLMIFSIFIFYFTFVNILNFFINYNKFSLISIGVSLVFDIIILFYFFFSIINNKSNLKDFLPYLYSLNLLMVLQILTLFLKHNNPFVLGYAYAKNITAIGLEVFLPFTLYNFCLNKKRIDCLILTLVNLILIYFSASRGALLTSILLLPFLIYICFLNMKKKNKKYLFTILILGVILIIFALIFKDKTNKIFQKINDIFRGKIFFNGRDIIWNMSIEGFKKSPLIGNGMSIFFQIDQNYSILYRPVSGTYYTLSHNLILTLLASGGIIFLLLFIYHIYEAFNKTCKLKDNVKYPIIYLLLFGLIHGLVDNTFFSMMYTVPYLLIFTANDFLKPIENQNI